MQNTKQISVVNEIQVCAKSRLIHQCEDIEIVEVLNYIFVLIGIRAELIPKDLAEDVLIVFIKKRLLNISLEEMRLSFEYAVERRTEVNLTLFGDTFSAKTIMEVWAAYSKYKKVILEKQPKEQGFTNNQTMDVILKMLPKETVESIKSIGVVDKKVIKPVRVPTENELIIQDILREFDELHRKIDYEKGTRMISYNGSQLTASEFLEVRLKEINDLKP